MSNLPSYILPEKPFPKMRPSTSTNIHGPSNKGRTAITSRNAVAKYRLISSPNENDKLKQQLVTDLPILSACRQIFHPLAIKTRKKSDPSDRNSTNPCTEHLSLPHQSTDDITKRRLVSFPCILCLFLSCRYNAGSLGEGRGKVRYRPPRNIQTKL